MLLTRGRKHSGDTTYEATETVTAARAHEEDARCMCDEKFNETVVTETNCANNMQVVLGEADAREKHVPTVTVWADSLHATESDFFRTIFERHEEAQTHLNAFLVLLNTAVSTADHAPKLARLSTALKMRPSQYSTTGELDTAFSLTSVSLPDL